MLGCTNDEIEHEVMAPSAPDHRTAKTGGEPVSGDFEVEAVFTIGTGGDQFTKLIQRVGDGVSGAVVPPAFGGEHGKLACIGGTGLHGRRLDQGAWHSPARGGDHVIMVGEVERRAGRFLINKDREHNWDDGRDFWHGGGECAEGRGMLLMILLQRPHLYFTPLQ